MTADPQDDPAAPLVERTQPEPVRVEPAIAHQGRGGRRGWAGAVWAQRVAAHQPAIGRRAGRRSDVLAVLRAGRQSGDPDHMVRGDWSPAGTTRTSARSSWSTCRTATTWTAPSSRPRLPRAQGPDLFIISPGDFLRYYNGGVLQDLTPFMEQEAIDDFFPDVLASRIVDDKVYGLPMEVEPMAMYYDMAAWDEAGLTDSDIPQTWDQLLEVGQQLTNDQRFGVLFETNPGYYQNFTWYPFMWQGGAEIQNGRNDERHARSRRGAGAQVLAGRGQPRRLARAPSSAAAAGTARRTSRTGYCAIQNIGIWAISELRQDAPDSRVRHLQAAGARGWNLHHRHGRLGVRRQLPGQGSGGGGAVHRLGARLDERGFHPARRRLVHEGEERHDPRASRSRISRSSRVVSIGTAEASSRRRSSRAVAAEPRVTPEIYKSISDAIQAAMLNGTDPAAGGGAGGDRDRGVPRHLHRRADPMSVLSAGQPADDQAGRRRATATRRRAPVPDQAGMAGRLSLPAAGPPRAADLYRPADGPVIESRLFQRLRLRPVHLHRARQLPEDAGRSALHRAACRPPPNTSSCWCPGSTSSGLGWRCSSSGRFR